MANNFDLVTVTIDPKAQQKKAVSTKKLLLIILGFISLGLGTLGLFLPLVPTTPLVLLAAACFSKSSKKFDDWLRQNRLFGSYIEDYQSGIGISKTRKASIIAFLWASLIVSMVIVKTVWIYAILCIVGICVTIHILTIKTKK